MTIYLSRDGNLAAPVDAPVLGTIADEPNAHGVAGLLARIQVEHESAVIRVIYRGNGGDIAPMLDHLRHAIHRPRVWIDFCHAPDPSSVPGYLAEHDAHFFFHTALPSAAILRTMVDAAASGRPLGVRNLPFWNTALSGLQPGNFVEHRLLREVTTASLRHGVTRSQNSPGGGWRWHNRSMHLES